MNFYKFFEILLVKSIFDLKAEVSRTKLGYLWWIIEPILYVATFYFVFSVVLNRGGVDYVNFLLIGMVHWLWFAKCISFSSNSILINQQLIRNYPLPIVFYPLTTVFVNTLKQIPVVVVLVFFLLFSKDSFNIPLIPLAFLWTIQILLTVAICVIVAGLVPFIRDIANIVPSGLMLLMFMSGIFYDLGEMSSLGDFLLEINPMAFLIKSYRDIIINSIPFNYENYIYLFTVNLFLMAVSLYVISKFQHLYPKLIKE